jgi:LmbE family N-acetylglucosaminyl deacetylase
MNDNPFRYTRRSVDNKIRTTDLAEILGSSDVSKETWLCVVPHDDDMIIGGGLWMHAGVRAGADVHLIITTDGRMGYCSDDQRPDIIRIRANECVESCARIGIDADHVHFLNYPDSRLAMHAGRYPSDESQHALAGFAGLQNAYTYWLRTLRPQRVFTPSPRDYHPDHQVVHNELQICLFHAGGDIWPELGEKIDVPEFYEMAIYCDYASPPNLQLRCDETTFAAKLDGLASYRSQLQIDLLVKKVKEAGPVEYLNHVQFEFYDATAYGPLFE